MSELLRSRSETLAYCAGVFDGEGSAMLLGQGPGRPRRPQLSVAMTDPQPVEYLHDHLGGFLRTRAAEPGNNRQAQRRWMANGSQALAAARAIEPYLVIARRKDLVEMLVRNYPTFDHRNIPDKDATRRRHQAIEALWADMRTVNTKRQEALPKIERQDPTPEDWAYAAGVLDGEGHITQSDQRVEISSTDPELVAWLDSRFAGGRVYDRGVRSERHNRVWLWVISPTTGGREFLAGVRRYLLVPHKREQANVNVSVPYAEHLPGTALEIAAATGANYRTIDKRLRGAVESGLLVRAQRPVGRRGGRPSWEYSERPEASSPD